MVKVKRIYDPVTADDGKRIYVDRLWPRGIRKSDAVFDEWLKEASPSSTLRKWFGHDPERWSEFKERYTRELKDKGEIMAQLREAAQEETITLLFSAKDRSHNNAVVMKEVLDEETTGDGRES
jgi:uncharacterized protein YeaO (DUF488 family)